MNIPFRKTGPKLWLNLWLVILFILPILLFSCKTQKQVQYLQGPFDTAALSQINIPEPIIQKGDLIGITAYSDNPELTMIYNQQMNTSFGSTSVQGGSSQLQSSTSNSQNMPGYLVDQAGNIQFQSLGMLHVEGLTKLQLSALLQDKLSKYLKNPYFNIRFINYKFTILGEVNKQGVYSVPGEKINILEALGMAGDITLYGLKDSLIVVREKNGKRSIGTVDVSRSDVFSSPFFYLEQNDVIIVKANPKKPSVSDQTTTKNLTVVATIAAILTSLSVILNFILK